MRPGTPRTVAAGALGAVAALSAAGTATLRAQETGGAPPSLSGRWFPDHCIPDGATCPFDVDELRLTPRAVKFMAEFDEAISPKYDCVPATTPGIVADPYVWRIEQRSDRVVLHYEKDDVVRTVWMDGRRHPPASERSVQGHSTGRYEGGALVVETANFTYDPIGLDDMAGLPSSTLKTVTERYRRDGDRLLVDVTVEDRLYLEEPAQAHFEWQPTDLEMLPYECDPEKARQPIQFLPD